MLCSCLETFSTNNTTTSAGSGTANCTKLAATNFAAGTKNSHNMGTSILIITCASTSNPFHAEDQNHYRMETPFVSKQPSLIVFHVTSENWSLF